MASNIGGCAIKFSEKCMMHCFVSSRNLTVTSYWSTVGIPKAMCSLVEISHGLIVKCCIIFTIIS